MDASGCRPAALSRKHSDFITEPRAATFPRRSYWSVAVAPATSGVMGEHVAQQNIDRHRINRKRREKADSRSNRSKAAGNNCLPQDMSDRRQGERGRSCGDI